MAGSMAFLIQNGFVGLLVVLVHLLPALSFSNKRCDMCHLGTFTSNAGNCSAGSVFWHLTLKSIRLGQILAINVNANAKMPWLFGKRLCKMIPFPGRTFVSANTAAIYIREHFSAIRAFVRMRMQVKQAGTLAHD